MIHVLLDAEVRAHVVIQGDAVEILSLLQKPSQALKEKMKVRRNMKRKNALV
jgi:hypothetical protein